MKAEETDYEEWAGIYNHGIVFADTVEARAGVAQAHATMPISLLAAGWVDSEGWTGKYNHGSGSLRTVEVKCGAGTGTYQGASAYLEPEERDNINYRSGTAGRGSR